MKLWYHVGRHFAVGCALLACSRQVQQRENPRGPGGSRAVKSAREVPEWPRRNEVLSWQPLPPGGFMSRGHGQPIRATVRVTPGLEAQYATLVADTTLPSGSLVVLVAEPEQVPLWAMEKLANGSWDYVAVSRRQGAVRFGPLSGCARCHGDAPNDHLFGLPRQLQ